MPGTGVEPVCHSHEAADFKSAVSTNSTTRARRNCTEPTVAVRIHFREATTQRSRRNAGKRKLNVCRLSRHRLQYGRYRCEENAGVSFHLSFLPSTKVIGIVESSPSEIPFRQPTDAIHLADGRVVANAEGANSALSAEEVLVLPSVESVRGQFMAP